VLWLRDAARPNAEPEFRRIIENMQDAFFRADLNGRLVMVSESAARLYGYESARAMVGLEAVKLYRDPAARERMLADLRQAGGVLDRRGEGVRRDGSTFWVSLNVRYYRDEHGAIRGIEGFVRDITEHRQVEEALERSEQRFRRIIENMQDAYLCTDAAGRLIMASPSAARLFGYDSTEAMLGLPAVQLYRDAAERERMLARITPQGEVLDSTGQARRKDGSLFWVSINGRFARDAAGRWTSAEVFVRDITERRRAEEALRESEQRFRQMFEGSRAVMLLIDPATAAIVEANPAAARFYGYVRDELRRMTIPQINVQPPEQIHANMEQVAAGHGDYFTFTHRLATGELRSVEVRSTRIDSGGRPLLFSIIHDITERTQAEAALRESELFLARSQEVARIGSYKLDVAAGRWGSSPTLDQVFGIDARFDRSVAGWLSLVLPADASITNTASSARATRPCAGSTAWANSSATPPAGPCACSARSRTSPSASARRRSCAARASGSGTPSASAGSAAGRST
jgi:PAS domain S-box-containing protein